MFQLKRAFFQWFLFVCGLLAATYYAYLTDLLPMILIDKTHFWFIVLGVGLFTILHLGITSWRLDAVSNHIIHRSLMWPALAISILPLMGMLGTVSGFMLESDVLASGSAGLGPLGTALLSTWFGVAGAVVTHLLRFNILYCLSIKTDKETSA